MPTIEPASVMSDAPARGDAEVGHLEPAVACDDHVLRLHVAVDDAVSVGEAQCRQRLQGVRRSRFAPAAAPVS